MKRLILSMVLVGLAAPGAASAEARTRVEGVAMTTTRVGTRLVQAEFVGSMRRLWEDQVTLTRTFIISSLAGLGDADAIALRLLANQDAIGTLIKPFYGAAAGDRLAVLLRDHVMLAADVLKAARHGDDELLTARQLAWAANADEVAAFLAEVNPQWSRPALVQTMRRHLDLMTRQIKARLARDWTGDLEAAELSQAHTRALAELLTDGVLKQHRRRFAR